MATPTQTFPCPFCGRRMGVRVEMLGRHVRCPHCSQVVLAPTAPAAAPPTSDPAKRVSLTAPTPLAAPTPIPPENFPTHPPESPRPEQPQYTFDQRKETADSILSHEDESDDEVFSSKSENKVPVLPDVGTQPPTAPEPGKPRPPSPPFEVSSSQIPTLELRTPVDIVPAPISASTLLPAPTPVERPPSGPTTPSNPFAFDEAAPPQPLATRPEPLPITSPTVSPVPSTLGGSSDGEAPPPSTHSGRSQPAATGSPIRYKMFFYILVPYAALMTILAVYGLFFKSGGPDPGHPLSTIPDNFGEFDPAARKKVTQWKLDLDGPLPADQRAGLGQTIEVGQLRIEPVSVEKRPLRIVKEGKAAGDVQRRQTRFHALVLHLRIKNTSETTPIFPLDPAFTRSARVDDKPAMRLVIGKQTLYGGAIPWPFGERLKREYEEAQATDYDPLKPGESREYVVFTNEDSTIASTVRKMTEPLLWRVQVRRGLIEFKGKDIPVTAIIGVEFQSSDIENLD